MGGPFIAPGLRVTGDVVGSFGAAFWTNQAIKLCLLYVIAFLAGLWVARFGIRVNYTRKINHFALFFSPPVLDRIVPFPPRLEAELIAGLLGIAGLLVYVMPLRRSSWLIDTAFKSFDRPEDRPHTLSWLTTQVVASFLILVPLAICFRRHGAGRLLEPIILTTGIGDGLAEPVGVRFGKHRYTTWGLFTARTYTRSLEGSACVLLVGLVTIVLYKPYLTGPQFLMALLTFPPLMTLAEAFSPHTWDNPFLFLVGGLTLAAILTWA